MDGRDDNSNSSDAANSVQPGIFTPNPTTPPTPPAQTPVVTGSVVEPASATTGLSHPYVSNHPTQTFSSETGDIVIGNNAPKGRKKFLILVSAIILLFIVIIVLILLMTLGKDNNNYRTAFSEYQNLLNGKVEGEYSEKPFQTIVDQAVSGEDISKYADELDKRYNSFKSDFDRLKLTKESQRQVSARVETYSKIVQAISNYFRVASLSEQATRIYLEENATNAQDFINTIGKDNQSPAADSTATLQNMIAKYLRAQLRVIETYRQSGCVVGSEIDYLCAAEIGNQGSAILSEVITDSTLKRRDLDRFFLMYSESFMNETDRIGRLLEDL